MFKEEEEKFVHKVALQSVRTGSESHLASYLMGTWGTLSPRLKCPVRESDHLLLLVPRFRKSGPIPPSPIPVCCYGVQRDITLSAVKLIVNCTFVFAASLRDQ